MMTVQSCSSVFFVLSFQLADYWPFFQQSSSDIEKYTLMDLEIIRAQNKITQCSTLRPPSHKHRLELIRVHFLFGSFVTVISPWLIHYYYYLLPLLTCKTITDTLYHTQHLSHSACWQNSPASSEQKRYHNVQFFQLKFSTCM